MYFCLFSPHNSFSRRACNRRTTVIISAFALLSSSTTAITPSTKPETYNSNNIRVINHHADAQLINTIHATNTRHAAVCVRVRQRVSLLHEHTYFSVEQHCIFHDTKPNVVLYSIRHRIMGANDCLVTDWWVLRR